MIRFDLVCENDHEFDGWFSDNAGFQDQLERLLIECPACGSHKIEKRLMVPSLGKGTGKKPRPDEGEKPVLSSAADPVMKELVQQVRQLREHVSKTAEYVGKDFAKQARDIHYEDQPARPIYGEASMDDAKSLLEEGIDVAPLPSLPEDKN